MRLCSSRESSAGGSGIGGGIVLLRLFGLRVCFLGLGRWCWWWCWFWLWLHPKTDVDIWVLRRHRHVIVISFWSTDRAVAVMVAR